MNKPFPALCKDCKWSKPETYSNWNLRCHHPKVNAKDPWALGSASANGTACNHEREQGFFSQCSMKGKLWEPIDAEKERL